MKSLSLFFPVLVGAILSMLTWGVTCNMVFQPSTVHFDVIEGGRNNMQQPVLLRDSSLSPGSSYAYSIIEQNSLPSWLTLSPMTGEMVYGVMIDVQVRVSYSAIPAGTYQATIDYQQIANPSNRASFSVSLIVAKVNCTLIQDCASCLTTIKCGWCRDENMCIPSGGSSNDCTSYFPSSCPIPCPSSSTSSLLFSSLQSSPSTSWKDDQDDDDCSGHGTCDYNMGTCTCSANYYSPSCDTFCVSNTTCSGKGKCNLDTGRCDCDANFYSHDCTIYCNAAVNCSNNGLCNSNGTCDCLPSYYGDKCEYKQCPTSPVGDVCSNNGMCNATSGVCTCERNYYGNACGWYCDPLLTCGHGVCNTTMLTCSCYDGWYGASCSVSCDPLLNCTGHGYCTAAGTCFCNNDYYTHDCSVHCTNEDKCHNRGECNFKGDCVCDIPKYFGTYCNLTQCEPLGNACYGFGTCDHNTGQCKCDDEHACLADCSAACPAPNDPPLPIMWGLFIGAVCLVVISIVGCIIYRRRAIMSGYTRIRAGRKSPAKGSYTSFGRETFLNDQ
eukprot:TRINITY_DN17798_c0_g1_i3.p1 TRINITY_DN17798_c0_g1~~TRINITY_DN17798_c0_g1_i3.p1  ORF type:complete len:552 (+),score=37.66 TRINITY_DN17798_c0_g1_i3:45-1700(+)